MLDFDRLGDGPEEPVPCQEEGCENPGSDYYLPWLDEGPEPEGREPDGWYCGTHAYQHGWCWGCGQFWGGVESFEFGGGLCDNCKDDPDVTGTYEYDDDEYPPEAYEF